MKQFISPLTVQNLQAAAALLMGYDYFLSPYKSPTDNSALE